MFGDFHVAFAHTSKLEGVVPFKKYIFESSIVGCMQSAGRRAPKSGRHLVRWGNVDVVCRQFFFLAGGRQRRDEVCATPLSAPASKRPRLQAGRRASRQAGGQADRRSFVLFTRLAVGWLLQFFSKSKRLKSERFYQ